MPPKRSSQPWNARPQPRNGSRVHQNEVSDVKSIHLLVLANFILNILNNETCNFLSLPVTPQDVTTLNANPHPRKMHLQPLKEKERPKCTGIITMITFTKRPINWRRCRSEDTETPTMTTPSPQSQASTLITEKPRTKLAGRWITMSLQSRSLLISLNHN